MIGHLRGILIEASTNQAVVECAGVGYEVTTSSNTAAALPEVGQPISLRVFTHFQDHKIALYGFATADERDLFDLLITVKNVGPASAMKILSATAGPAEMAQLIAAQDVVKLKSLKGVGKKTAELLVVELHEKCQSLLLSWGASGADLARVSSSPRPSRVAVHGEVAAALVQMGWRPAEAEKAVELLPVDSSLPLETLLRQALQSLPRS